MASAMHAAQARVDVSADNLANVSSDGFRKHIAKLSLDARGVSVAPREDGSGGSLRSTGRAFDLAVAGKGALFVRDREGRVVTERSGAFARTSEGTFVDAKGRELLGQRGPLHASLEATIDARGIVRVNDRAIDRLRTTAGTEVRSGFLEASNVDAVREMVEVLSAQRAFETSQKTLSAIDDVRTKTVNDVVRVKS